MVYELYHECSLYYIVVGLKLDCSKTRNHSQIVQLEKTRFWKFSYRKIWSGKVLTFRFHFMAFLTLNSQTSRTFRFLQLSLKPTSVYMKSSILKNIKVVFWSQFPNDKNEEIASSWRKKSTLRNIFESKVLFLFEV